MLFFRPRLSSWVPLLIAAATLSSCLTPQTLRPYPKDFAQNLLDMAKSKPLKAEEKIRSEEVFRSPGSSLELVQVREGFPPILHDEHDEWVVMLEGEGVLNLAEKEIKLSQGSTIFIPRGMVHSFRVTGSKTVIALAIFSPPQDGKDTRAIP